MVSITKDNGPRATNEGQRQQVFSLGELLHLPLGLLLGCAVILVVVVSRSPATSYQKLTTAATATTTGEPQRQLNSISGIGSLGQNSQSGSSGQNSGRSFDFDFFPTFGASTATLESIFPFYRPRQYSLQPIDSFQLYFVCTDISREGCNAANTIEFTTDENPAPNAFRYLDSGPEQLQGVFWTRQDTLSQALSFLDKQFDFVRSELVTFAKTRHGGAVDTGVLQTDVNGYEFVFRVLGDHSWSVSENAPDTFASGADILYLFDLVEGTLENPLRFVITPSLKLLYNCLRFNFGELTQVVTKFEQILITDRNNEHRQHYPGSNLWIRRLRILNLLTLDYLIIQVVDGNGNKIEPAWSEYSEGSRVTQYSGLIRDRLDDRLQC